MLSKYSRLPLILTITLIGLINHNQAQAADRPAVLKALEAQGLTITKEFKISGGLRAFAAITGDSPVAVYVTSDGKAIIGTRVDDKGQTLDADSLKTLAAKPISEKQWKQLESSTYVRDGKDNAPRIIYAFSDANCPYCHRFWEAARPWVNAGKVQIRHIMVGVIREDSPAKAAAILGASNPSAALLENETKFNQGGIAPLSTISPAMNKILDDNQALMVEMGFRGTPGIIVQGPDGLLKKYNGLPQGLQLNEVMGAL